MIHVAPIHAGFPEAVGRICRHAQEVFHTESQPLYTAFAPDTGFDLKRQQYSSTALLAMLLDEVPRPGDKLVAITGGDLFIPVLTFVFGEAQLDGSVAITSTYRLREKFYGLPDNPGLTLDRLEKEVIHELGHTYGLRHCDNYMCAMHPCTGVEDIDLKGAELCISCARILWSREEEVVG